LDEQTRAFLLRHSFYSDPARMIYRFPRYGELYNAWRAGPNSGGRHFSPQDFRDLQMWSQLAWFDEEIRDTDPEVREWMERGRSFTLADQQRMGEKQREIVGKALPEYQRLARSGQIEISTTPYYHPILPLLCDSNIASVSHPNVPLPPRFRYPEDARKQLALALDYIARVFGAPPAGLWPSEGSVSDEVFGIAAELGFQWAASDGGVLERSLGRSLSVDSLYRPYEWKQEQRSLQVIFRDHLLSDLIGFVYAKMDSRLAALDFLRRLRENCAGILSAGRDALVPIILDGENAWEYYDRNGRPFLRELYRRMSEEPAVSAVTVSDALRLVKPEPLRHIFPGSWIDANFDVWIGDEEDNQAWTQLLRARETFDAAASVPEDRRRLAFEELLIAEGSDWCWWYGPQHDSPNRPEFDQLFRGHLANVYRFLNLPLPEELSRPILRAAVGGLHVEPSGSITPAIDGEVATYFEWMGAGIYRVDKRSGSMHGRKPFVDEIQFGSDGVNFYLRADFHAGLELELSGRELRLTVQSLDGSAASRIAIALDRGVAKIKDVTLAGAPPGQPAAVECAFSRVLEARISLAAMRIASGNGLRFQVSLWEDGLPLDAVPPHGWLIMRTTNPAEMGV
jgi:alpha-amylase/alpha-mannosidase (GH57 family)